MIDRKKTIAVTLASVMVIAGIGIALSELPQQPESEDYDPALGFLPIILGVALIFSSGFLLGYGIAGGFDGPGHGGDQEEVNAVMRQLEAEKVSWYGDGTISLASSVLPMNTAMWGFTQEHWSRAVELAVSDIWVFGESYDANYATERSMMRKNMDNMVYSWQAALDNAFTHSMISVINQYNAFEYLRDVSTQLVWDTGSAELRNSIIDFSTLISNADAGQTIYVDASTYTSGGTYQQSTSGMLYNLSASNVILRDIWTGSNTTSGLTVTLNPGANDISATGYNGTTTPMRSGLYRVETQNTTIAGPLSMAADANAAKVYGTMVHASNEITWFTFGDDTTFVNKIGMSPAATENLSMEIGYVDRNGNNAIAETKLVGTKDDTGQDPNLIGAWQNLIERMNITIDIAGRSGEVMWTIFDICQESNAFLAPSSMIGHIPGLNFNPNQAAMFALQQMMQIARVYEIYGDKLDREINMVFNPQSLDLYIRGNIYNNNMLMYEDVVFTPFSLLEEQTFIVGETTVWRNAGFIQIWGSGDINGWSGPSGTMSYSAIQLGTGYEIEVIQIGRSGQLINDITLTPEEIERFTVDPGNPPGPSTPPVIKAIVDTTPILLMFFGGLILFIGIRTEDRNRKGIILLGTLIFTAGLIMFFWSDIVAWFRSLLNPFGWIGSTTGSTTDITAGIADITGIASENATDIAANIEEVRL
jgi:hypothetical protein